LLRLLQQGSEMGFRSKRTNYLCFHTTRLTNQLTMSSSRKQPADPCDCRKLVDDVAPVLEHPEEASLLNEQSIRSVLKCAGDNRLRPSAGLRRVRGQRVLSRAAPGAGMHPMWGGCGPPCPVLEGAAIRRLCSERNLRRNESEPNGHQQATVYSFRSLYQPSRQHGGQHQDSDGVHRALPRAV
jgi:hypothetical protein